MTESAEGEAKAGTFLVTAAEAETAVVRDVSDGQVHTVESPPADLAVGEVITGALEPVMPMAVAWRLDAVDERYRVEITESPEPPTTHERSLAPATVGELVREERAGEGELHVISVPEDGEETAEAVADVLADETGLRERAARLGVERVEVRSEPGVVCVRYLP